MADGAQPILKFESLGPVKKNGEEFVDASAAVEGAEYVMLYFSAHWCPPCKWYTPILAEKYKDYEGDAKVEIIFISWDKDQAACDEYSAEMPWYTLDYDKRDKNDELRKAYGINAIPTLMVFDKEGNFITNNGRVMLEKLSMADAVAKKFQD